MVVLLAPAATLTEQRQQRKKLCGLVHLLQGVCLCPFRWSRPSLSQQVPLLLDCHSCPRSPPSWQQLPLLPPPLQHLAAESVRHQVAAVVLLQRCRPSILQDPLPRQAVVVLVAVSLSCRAPSSVLLAGPIKQKLLLLLPQWLLQ